MSLLRSAGLLLAALLPLLPASPPASGQGPGERSAQVLVIRGTFLGEGGESMAGLANDAFAAVSQALATLGIPYRASTDGEVAQGLEDPRLFSVIVLPYNRALSPAQINLISQALTRGARLVAFYHLPDELAGTLGVRLGDYEKLPSGASRVILADDATPSLPAALPVHPRFIRACEVRPPAAVAAWWELGKPSAATGERSDRGAPAVALSPGGAVVSFMPASEDSRSLAQLLWGLLGDVAPEVVSASLPRSLRQLGPVGPYESLADLRQAWRLQREPLAEEAFATARQAEDLVYQLQELLAEGKLSDAFKAATEARRLANVAYWRSLPDSPQEFRAVWAHPWGTPDWEQTCARLAQARFNMVFPYVASAGVAYYPSNVLPRHSSRDYLTEAVTAAARHGIELHPRLLVMQCLFASRETRQAYTAAGRMALNSKGATSDWLCPTDPRNRQQLLDVAREIVTRHPVPGLHLDYIRMEGMDNCVCPRCRRHFEQATGKTATRWPQEILSGTRREEFLRWRRETITGLVRELRAHLRSVRPEVRLSVAVFPDWERHPRGIAQDPVAWAREGLVDLICPMNYTANLGRFQELVAYQSRALEGRVPLAPGIGAFSDACRFETPQELADQILAARKLGGQGFVVFNYNRRFADDFLPWIELGLTRSPSPPPWAP